MLVAARLLLGLGSSAAFMAAVVMCSRWFAGERLASALSWVFALSQLGILLASSPLAAASETIGWRWAFVVAAVVTGAVGLAFWLLVTADHPDGRVGAVGGRESMRDALRGIAEVMRTPHLANVLAVQAVAYACIATVLGLWAGPYLFDVHGLDPVARGHVIALMTVAHIAGVLACGPLDARLNTRRGIVVAGGAATAVLLAVLALVPGLPTGVAIALLVAMCVTASFGPTLVAHGRSLFPDRLAGRGMTTLNLAQVIGASLLPLLSGVIAAALSPVATASAQAGADGGYPEVAYRAIFGLLATALALGVVAYARGPDSKPRPG
jgi:predicted MFS family arabinose efflux permease